MRKTRDPRTGETYYTFTDGTAERIVGAINEAKEDLSLRERDGETWIVAKGRLFSFYAPELVGKIVRTGRMDVSAETEVRGEIGHDGDVEVYRDWIGIGVTILGDDVDPAVPGARIAALSSMEGEFQELKLRAAALRSGTTEKTKKGVENHMNKQAIARLSSKFEGYRIVALSEDGKTVGMVDESGAPLQLPLCQGFRRGHHGETVSRQMGAHHEHGRGYASRRHRRRDGARPLHAEGQSRRSGSAAGAAGGSGKHHRGHEKGGDGAAEGRRGSVRGARPSPT